MVEVTGTAHCIYTMRHADDVRADTTTKYVCRMHPFAEAHLVLVTGVRIGNHSLAHWYNRVVGTQHEQQQL